MIPLTHVGLFEGIGGFSLAAKWAGFESVQHVEIDPFRRSKLGKNFPGVPCHGDIKTYGATHLMGLVGVLTAGFPCQDISAAAGARAVGIFGERSGLVTHALRIVGECRPPFLVFENSPRLRVRGGDWLLGQIRSLGYRCDGFLVRASDLGARHDRERAFVVAHADEVGGDSPREHLPTPQLAPDQRRQRPQAQFGRIDLVLRPGSEPRFSVSSVGQKVSGPCLLRSLDGIPAGVDRVKALGDSVPPQMVYPILKAIANQLRGCNV